MSSGTATFERHEQRRQRFSIKAMRFVYLFWILALAESAKDYYQVLGVSKSLGRERMELGFRGMRI